MKWLNTFLLGFLLLLALTPALAQEATVELEAYTDDNFGFSSVRPAGWQDGGFGLYRRADGAADITLIAQQAAAAAPEVLMESILPQLGLSAAPESIGTHESETMIWTLYQVDVPAGAMTIRVHFGMAQADSRTYVVFLQSPAEESDVLYEQVFVPMLDALTPVTVAVEDLPYIVEDVTFDNGDVTLAGNLTLPEGAGPHPAVVLVSGSGPQNRDEDLGLGLKPFSVIADYLTRQGIAVLRYDDRGVAESTGTFAQATIDDFASDAQAAVTYLLTRDDINPEQIGILGHSEGGIVAARLGATDDRLAFLVSMAGTAVNGLEILLRQNELLLKAEGFSDEYIQLQVDFLTQVAELLPADDLEAIEQLTRDTISQQYALLPDDQRAALGDLDDAVDKAVQSFMHNYAANAWFESFLNNDPGLDWAQTTIPVLFVLGGKDLQVPADVVQAPFEAAMAQAGNEDFEVVVFPNANHLMQEAETGAISEYATLAQEFTPEFLPTVAKWILERVDVAG